MLGPGAADLWIAIALLRAGRSPEALSGSWFDVVSPPIPRTGLLGGPWRRANKCDVTRSLR
jgi:hypothetical protein